MNASDDAVLNLRQCVVPSRQTAETAGADAAKTAERKAGGGADRVEIIGNSNRMPIPPPF